MHVDNDQLVDLLAVEVAQVSAYHRGELHELSGELPAELLHREFVSLSHAIKDVGHLPRPPNLRPHQRHHAELLQNPLTARHLGVVEHPLLGDVVQRLAHLRLHAEHPNLHRAFRGGRRTEIERLSLRRGHPHHSLVPPAKFERRAVVVELEHVLLHGRGIGRAQHGEKLVVGDKKEARERIALVVEVLGQGLLASLQHLAEFLKALEAVLL